MGPTAEGTAVSKGRWTPEEDAKLIEAVTKFGKDWVVAATRVGRTNVHTV
jgi:hypothetical protein